MSATNATLAGHRVTDGRAELHAWGAWYAEASLDSEVTLKGAADFVINDLTLKGTILSGGPAHGRSFYRLVGGAGGWGTTLPAKSYGNDAGVKLSNVLNDAAQAAGEKLDASTLDGSARLGPAWTRDKGRACDVLHSVAPQAWYVGEDGITRLGRRKTTTFTGQATRIEPVDQQRKTLTIACETIAPLVPGVTVDGLEAIDVIHTIGPDGLRSTLYGAAGIGAGASAYLDSIAAIYDAIDPDRRFRGTYEYRVVTRSGNRVNLQPTLVSSGMPDLQHVPFRPGVAGAKSDVAPGSRVLVTWANADRGRPVVVGCEEPDANGFIPESTILDASTSVNVGDSAGTVNLAGGSDNVALAAKVDQLFTALKNTFQSWTPVSMDGGAALKALLTTMLATGWPSSVASAKTKAT